MGSERERIALGAASARVRALPVYAPPPAPLVVRVRLPTRRGTESPAIEMAVSAKRSRHAADSSGSEDAAPDAGDSSDGTGSTDASRGGDRLLNGAQTSASHAKPRRPAYSTLQKQERDALTKEVQMLKAQADLLRERAGLSSVAAADLVTQTAHANRLMDDTRRAQLLALCGMRSVISRNLRDQFNVPLSIPIRLGEDPRERRATLLSLRRSKLDRTYRYLEERFRGVELTRRHQERETWTSPGGNFCASTCDVTLFRGVRSVKQVYDAFMFYMANMEISISETLGQLTLREDIDSVDTSVSNHRFSSSTDHGLVVEMNVASFGEYHERFPDHQDQEFALYTADCVDEDAVYPYCPHERVRKDISGAVAMSPLPKKHPNDALVVVMRRAAYLQILRPQFPVDDAALDDLEANLGAWGDVMFQSMHATLSTDAATPSSG